MKTNVRRQRPSDNHSRFRCLLLLYSSLLITSSSARCWAKIRPAFIDSSLWIVSVIVLKSRVSTVLWSIVGRKTSVGSYLNGQV